MTTEIVNTLTSNLVPGDHPYLQGAWTPLHEEVDATDLKVLEGHIPLDLDGVYLRNVKQAGNKVNIVGYAQSNARVSTLLRNLESSPWLDNATLVEIKAA